MESAAESKSVAAHFPSAVFPDSATLNHTALSVWTSLVSYECRYVGDGHSRITRHPLRDIGGSPRKVCDHRSDVTERNIRILLVFTFYVRYLSGQVVQLSLTS